MTVEEMLSNGTDKMEKAFKDMAVLKTKVESVEKYLIENKEARRK